VATVTMPQLGFDMREGTLVRWLKQPGDKVEKGEPLAEIETDKAIVELESFFSGVVTKLLVEEGTTVPVGQPIAVIDTGDEQAPEEPAGQAAEIAAPPAQPAAQPTAAAPAAAEPVANGVSAPAEGGRIKASPLARRLAAEHGIALQTLTGSGPGGRIVKADVLQAVEQARAAAPAATAPAGAPVVPAAAAAPAAPSPADRVVPLTRMRETIARRMSESKQQAPHFYVTMAIDMDKAMELRANLNQLGDGQVKVSVNDMVIKATAIALLKHPYLNATFEGNAIRIHGAVHMAVAVALDDGLITPVIRDAHAKSLLQISQEARALAEAARAGTLRPEQYQGGTFTISNLGMFGVEEFAAIINPPQAAILAVGAVQEQPVVRNGQLTVGKVMRVTVSADHRVADGAQVALFLQELKNVLENPLRLLV